MSTPLQIRDVPDDVRRTLKARAAACGKSLNSYLLDLVKREAARPTVAEVLDRAMRRAERLDVSGLDVLADARAERDDQLRGRRQP